MPEENRQTLRYRILRYTPNLVRDEWVNIGVLLEDVDGPRRAIKLIEENSEIARVRRLHPSADEILLRALPAEMESRLAASEAEARTYLEKLGDTLSNVLQFGPTRALIAEDFNAEIERLYHDHVAPPPGVRGGIVENTRGWIRNRLRDVFRRKQIFRKMDQGVRVEEFTQPGDPMKLDYGYRYNGTRGFIHAVALGRDPSQAKVLAYTAEAIRSRLANSVFTAITEIEPASENPRHRFVARLLEEQRISIVPLNRVERFAEDLRSRLQ
jgi:hypothetical protein